MLIVGFVNGATGSTFEVVASLGGLLLMIKFLSFLKVLSIRLATFVLALGIIVSDISSFLAVLAVVMLGFGYAFYVLISDKTVSLHDDEPDNVRARYTRTDTQSSWPLLTSSPSPRRSPQPFGSTGETMLTMFNMGMLGDFDRDVFEGEVPVVLFVAFMFTVVIVMLNVSRSAAAVLLLLFPHCHTLALSLLAPRRCSSPSSLIHTVGDCSARYYMQI